MYNLKFIGNIGVGKTTAICNLLGLVDANNKPILDVGSGRTTICDVYIRKNQNESNNIYTKTYSLKEFRQLFSLLIDNPAQISTELQYAIRNMVRSNGVESLSQDLIEWKSKNKNLRDFKFIYSNRAKYKFRNTSFLSFISNDKETTLKWVKDNFHLINTGMEANIGLPRKIEIRLRKSIVNDDLNWEQIQYIIDTKGLENNNITPENNQNTIEVYCSSFSNGPENNLIRYIENSNINKSNKVFLVLPKYDEPFRVHEAEGNYENGISLKRCHFKQQLNEKIIPDNIIFYDSKINNKEIFIEKIKEITTKAN